MTEHEPSKKQLFEPNKEQMRAELEKYFDHVLKHKPEQLDFTIMLAGHNEDEDKDKDTTHVCTMIGGPPIKIYGAMCDLIDQISDLNPALRVGFLMHVLKGLTKNAKVIPIGIPDLSKFDELGGDAAAEQVANILKTFNLNTNSDDETKH